MFSLSKVTMVLSFLITVFKNLLQAKGVRHITVNVGDHNRQGLIERFKNRLPFMKNQGNQTDTLMSWKIFVYYYNHTYHRGVNDIPELRYQKNPSSGWSMKVKTTKHSINVGDHVRTLKKKENFQKRIRSKV